MVALSGDLNSRTPAGLLAYCDWLTGKGYATSAQVNPWKIAARKVFQTVEGEGYESLDLSSVDLDEYLARFQTLAGAQYKAESITAYKRRIQNALDAHEHYLSTGRPPTFRQGTTRQKRDDAASRSNSTAGRRESETPATAKTEAEGAVPTRGSGLIDFPFVLKDGRMATLRLPPRVASDDVNRLSGFLRTLQDDAVEQRQIPKYAGREAA